MKKRLTSFTALFIFALGCSTSADAQTSPQARAMKELRDRLLTSSPEEVGLSGEDAEAKVWGVLMEVALPEGIATLVSIRDGTASLYTSTGGGILGGYTARKEATQFVTEAEKHLASMKPAKSFPYPEVGRVKFYVLTRGGVYTAETDQKEAQDPRHPFYSLFLDGNKVLAVLGTVHKRSKPVV